MYLSLNNLKPGKGAKSNPKRLGRGIGSGWGKTSGRGHKGQHARKGGYHKLGFEGGQTPLQRSLRKFGFSSAKQMYTREISLKDLAKLSENLTNETVIDLKLLKEKGFINKNIKWVKVILNGELKKPVQLKGLKVTKGARSAIEALKGGIES